jgi:hypothetical protein
VKTAEQQPGRERSINVRSGDGREVHLVRDLLDKQLVDSRHDPLGRVDGIVLAAPQEGPPWVACLESGPTVLARRLGRRSGKWARALARRRGLRGGQPVRTDWRSVTRIGLELELDAAADQMPFLVLEHWLLHRILRHVPSLKPRKGQTAQRGQEPQAQDPTKPPSVERATPSRPRWRVRLHELLGTKVIDAAGQPAGRIEEVRARLLAGWCIVEQFVLGREGLMERLSVRDLSLAALRLLGARHRMHGRHVPWRLMDLSDPRQAKLHCLIADLPQ